MLRKPWAIQGMKLACANCSKFWFMLSGDGLLHARQREQRKIHADLHGTAQVEHDNVLQIGVAGQGGHVGGASFTHPGQAVAERIEFARYDQPIHACRRSASVRST